MGDLSTPSIVPVGEVREAEPAARLAFRFLPITVRALLPAGTVGAYVLLAGHVPLYVGRSDTCLRQRLSTHNHLSRATHVLWEITTTARDAFHLEAFWWHQHRASLINEVHPAAPALSGGTCPFCADEAAALARAFGPAITDINTTITHTTERITTS